MVQKNSLEPFIIVIGGPTASGKTSLAIKLANELNGEIVSADSIAIYKQLNIGTAKPNEQELKMAKHHMVSVVDAKVNFTVSDYENMALKIVEDILARGKTPIISGGTGYYINSILYKQSYGECDKDQSFRDYCENIISTKGNNALYEMLKDIDYESYLKLKSNDTMRVIRALEIYHLTGKKKSQIIDNMTPRFKFFAYSYDYDRSVLYDRINERVDKMFELGLVDEVKDLIKNGIGESCQSMSAIGYKEIVYGLKNSKTIEEMKDEIKLNSRHYAKRQITWFKKLDGIKYLTMQDFGKELDIIKKDVFYDGN